MSATEPMMPEEAAASEEDYGPLARPPAPIELAVPEANARRGRILFISNGCVICHQVNGVGGTAAPALDRDGNDSMADPLAFSAAMWRGARAMTALQMMQRGYVIQLDGQDIADLAAFTASAEERSLLTESAITPAMRSWFLTEAHRTEDALRDALEDAGDYPFAPNAPTNE